MTYIAVFSFSQVICQANFYRRRKPAVGCTACAVAIVVVFYIDICTHVGKYAKPRRVWEKVQTERTGNFMDVICSRRRLVNGILIVQVYLHCPIVLLQEPVGISCVHTPERFAREKTLAGYNFRPYIYRVSSKTASDIDIGIDPCMRQASRKRYIRNETSLGPQF